MSIKTVILKALEVYSDQSFTNSNIIKWAPPVISFGQLSVASVATVGLNPSSLEFLDKDLKELNGANRRFHTLSSLQLDNWENINDSQLNMIIKMYETYFSNNPYNVWFNKLEYILNKSKLSYYFPISNTCHLDIVPYTTLLKWNELMTENRDFLIKISTEILGLILRDSKISFLILNGQSVVDNFEKISDSRFNMQLEPSWNLSRKNGNLVIGKSYVGNISQIGNIELKRNIKVVGFNHNLQSSFGITKKVMEEIQKWISNEYFKFINL